jgi:hypothetical protein
MVSVYRWQQGLVGVLLVLVGVFQGCGTGEYENRLQQRVATMGQETAFADFGTPVPLPDSTLTVSMPKEFQPAPANADPKRVKIPFAELPEWKATYEGGIEDSAKGKQHYYCYLAVAAGDNDPGAALHGRVNAAMAGTPAPADAQVPTPSGKQETWRRFRATGKQAFWYTEANGTGRLAEMDGILEVWSRKVPEGNCWVLIAWRVPTVNGKDFVNLDQKGPLMAGSVTVKK